MTTTNEPEKGAEKARRRQAVRLTMVAGSAMVLAVSWAGVVQADRGQEPLVAAVPPTAVSGTVATSQAAPAVSTANDGTLVPASPATRQVIVVRRSRAS